MVLVCPITSWAAVAGTVHRIVRNFIGAARNACPTTTLQGYDENKIPYLRSMHTSINPFQALAFFRVCKLNPSFLYLLVDVFFPHSVPKIELRIENISSMIKSPLHNKKKLFSEDLVHFKF